MFKQQSSDQIVDLRCKLQSHFHFRINRQSGDNEIRTSQQDNAVAVKCDQRVDTLPLFLCFTAQCVDVLVLCL